jgi:RND family efflux transporter MFP subunit
LEVRPQVSGHVVEVHPSFQVGGRVKTGEVLFKIDPRDYEIALDVARAELTRAEFELKLEQGSQVVAKREWDLLGAESSDANKLNRELALRIPHMRQKQAALKAARSQFEKAKLDLERTRIKAPFDVLVLNEAVEEGKFLSPQTIAAKVVATKEFFVKVKIPRASLKWVGKIDDANKMPVKIIQDVGGKEQVERKGNLLRNIGRVEEMGRMVQLLISISNPLDPPNGLSQILLGSYVRVEIEGPRLDDVIAIPRAALRENSRVWIVGKESKLEYRKIEVLHSKDEKVFIQDQLKTGELIITSPVKNALEGTLLEVSSNIKQGMSQ